MNVWCHLPTIFKRRHSLLITGLIALCVAITTTLFFVVPSYAATGTNQTLSFQGRLSSASGAIVPDGFYNIQFKIYQDGTGATAGNSGGALKWTESYVNNGGTNGVQVKNGYFSVTLGSKNPFGTSVDWNQDTLWLSMNVAGTSTGCSTFGTSPCTADGEMLPMKQLTATPYAMSAANANKLGGITSDGFIQNTTTQQTGNFNISGTGIASTLQGNTSVIAPLFDVAGSGNALNIGTVNAATINMGTNDYTQAINIGTGDGNKTIAIGSAHGTSGILLQGGSNGVRVDSSGGFAVHLTGADTDAIEVRNDGNTLVNLVSGGRLAVKNASGGDIMSVRNDNIVYTNFGTLLDVAGSATFENGITVQGTGSLNYTTPGGYNMHTAINIPNYTVGNFESVFAFGLPNSSSTTARGMLVADGRYGNHQSTIGVLSPDESAILGLSWKSDTGTGANAIGTLSNTANSLALQGNGLNLLTATNNAGAANVGIGNDASAGYALDVTGSIRASSALYTPVVDTAAAGTLAIGNTNATTINIGSNNATHTINVGTGTGAQAVNVGSTSLSSATTISSGTGGITLQTGDNASGAGSVKIDTGVGTPATSTVANKTFESGVDGMESWFSSSVASSSAQKRSGTKSLAMTAGDSYWGIQQSYPGTAITAGHQYTVSIWVRAATAGRTISAQIAWVGASGTPAIGSVTDTISGWTQLTNTFTAPTGATGLIIQIGNGGGSSVGEVHYFDDITINDLSAAGSSQSVDIGTNNAAKVTIGNNAQSGATTIYGGGGINLNNNTTIGSGKTLTANGSVLLQNSADSSTAFQIQNAAGANLMTVDTAQNNISLLTNGASTLSTWSTTNAMSIGSPSARVGGSAVSANGYLYYLGGYDGSNTISTVQVAKLNADGSVGTWAQTTSLPDARREFQATTLNGYLYVIGGRNASNTTVSTSYYAKLNADGSVGTWRTTTALPNVRYSGGTIAYNGALTYVGGSDGSSSMNTVYYAKANPDGTLASWSTGSNLPGAISSINNMIVTNGYAYAVGGFSGGVIDTILYSKIASDGTPGSWTAVNGALTSTGGGDENMLTYTAGGYLYAAGGDHGDRTVAYALNADGSFGSPVMVNNIGTSVEGEAASAQANGYFYALGGSSAADGGGTVRNSVYVTSAPRVKVGANLDLVGSSTGSLTDGVAGTLTAGNTTIVGTLDVRNQANFLQGMSVGGALSVNGAASFKTDSAIALQIQRADGTAMFVADNTAQTITIGNATSGDKTVISTTTGAITKYGNARNTKKITLNAEYTGSVLDPGTGSNNSGTMTSSVDLTNRMNYYKWTTTQSTSQSYDVVVQVPIPTDFDGWASSNPLAISTYTTNTTSGTITLEARDSTGTVRCNFVSVTPGSTGAWATNSSACTLSSGTYTAGDYMTFRIRMQSPNAGDVRIGNINLSYLSKY